MNQSATSSVIVPPSISQSPMEEEEEDDGVQEPDGIPDDTVVIQQPSGSLFTLVFCKFLMNVFFPVFWLVLLIVIFV